MGIVAPPGFVPAGRRLAAVLVGVEVLGRSPDLGHGPERSGERPDASTRPAMTGGAAA
jgi:hypothetical protein